MMFTIVQCVNSMDLGGLEQMVLTLSTGLRARGFGSEICCIEDRGALADQAEVAGIPVHALNMAKRGKLSTLRNFCAFLRSDRQVKSVSSPRSSVLIHSHNFKPFYYSALATMLGAANGHVHSRHGSLLRHHPATWRYRLLRHWVDAWVTVSADRRTELAKRTGLSREHIHVLANGVDTARFCPAADKRAIHAQLGLPLDTPIILCVARLAPEKDLGTLLRAFKILLAQYQSSVFSPLSSVTDHYKLHTEDSPRLVLVGDGSCMPELRNEANRLGIGEHVHFLGTRHDTHLLLQAADVFALSSLSEGLSVALIEAAACGLPIVATAVGGNHEVVNAPHGGRLVPAGNPDALAAGLLELLGNDLLRTTMSQAARQHAVSRFSIEQMVNGYIKLYEKALCRHGRPGTGGDV